MPRRPYRLITILLLLVLTIACSKPGIPDRTVVLTLDDTVANHLTFVVPLLEELGFGATFFHVSKFPPGRQGYLEFREVAEIHRRGFEVGNHSVTHSGFHRVATAGQLVRECVAIERGLAEQGVPKPVSFAWPGNAFGPECLAVLRDRGYRFARRGIAPEFMPLTLAIGPAFDPSKNDPLLIPTTGDAHPRWSEPHFRRVISMARDGKAVVLQFHGVPDHGNPNVSTTPKMFTRLMRILAEEDFNVIAMRDLEKYIDPAPLPSDPLTKLRWPNVE